MKRVTLTIKREWFDKIESGEKRIEYREAKRHWEQRFRYGVSRVRLRNGYSKDSPTLICDVTRCEWLRSGLGTDLNIDRPVYALHLANVVRIK